VLDNGVKILVPPFIAAGTRIVVNIASARTWSGRRTEAGRAKAAGHGRPVSLFTVMERAARKAGRGLVRDFGEIEQLQVSVKSPGDFVSAADRHAEETLRERACRGRPGYGFLGEEGGEASGDGEHRWIVDPLDGTTNFLHGIPHFAISIGARGEGRAGRRPGLQPGRPTRCTGPRRAAAPSSTIAACASRPAQARRDA
jgi:fructose-1,6-bisphosphatase/inositol monophosphatase family enzyme